MMNRENRSIFVVLISCFLMGACSIISADRNDETNESLHLLWEHTYDIPEYYSSNVVPFVYGESIIVSGGKSVMSLSISDGTSIWKSPLNHESSLSNRSFAFQNDLLVGSIPRQVLAWDIHTGEEMWRVAINDSLSWNFGSPEIAVDEQRFVTMGLSRELYSLSNSGILDVYNVDLSNQRHIINDQVLYVAQRKENNLGVVSAYNSNTLELLWRYDQNELGYIVHVPPLLDDNRLFVFFFGANRAEPGVVALDAITGEEIWVQTDITPKQALIEGDVIYGRSSTAVWAINKFTGELIWQDHLRLASIHHGNLVYFEGYLYVPYSRGLRVFEADTGEDVLFMEPPKEETLVHAVKGADQIFLQSSRHLYAFAPWGY